MAGKVRKCKSAFHEFKSIVQEQIENFQNSLDECLQFPLSLSKDERAYIHKFIRHLGGLVSKSQGKGTNRCIFVYKKIQSTKTRWIALTPQSRHILGKYLVTDFPSSIQTPKQDRNKNADKNQLFKLPAISKNIIPPRCFGPRCLAQERSRLPIANYKEEILNAIDANRVIIVNGDTGSGKTTQLPQYILEKSWEKRVPCRIICTQPRRMAAVTIAQRVAKERGEKLGSTVGYLIKLEGCVNKKTNLIYTTSGCVLRSLMKNIDDTFNGLTHIIIDEIHERDKNTDFILISLRDQLKVNNTFKVILMSATMDTDLLCNYFDGIPIITVPGRCYETKIFHLEDILLNTNFMGPLVLEKYDKQKQAEELVKLQRQKSVLDEETQKYVDEIIDQCFDCVRDSDEHFAQLNYMIASEEISINVIHSVNLKTPLIVAAQLNNFEYVKKFSDLGACKLIMDEAHMTALDYASTYIDRNCLKFLQSHEYKASAEVDENTLKQSLLDEYEKRVIEDDEVDHILLITILENVIKSQNQGSVLIFLPGYNDILTQRDFIVQKLPPNKYKLFLLHSCMSIRDQQDVIAPCPVRKIILSTNIGETSITFPDVSFVIDTGKIKVNSFDSITGTSYLKSTWISKAGAQQRAGRAGRTRTGICYRMFSYEKYTSMAKFAIPEFLRIPLTEICLYAKAINKSADISTYLSNALQAPSSVNIHTAVNLLKVIGALDEDENITELGGNLVEMPLEVQLGKCVLFSIVLKCFDPILTIVAFHSVKDPFILPQEREERGKASSRRKVFAGESFSDHVGIINMYQQWRENKAQGIYYERRFCNDNYLSIPNLEMMYATRKQIYEHIKRTYNFSESMREINKNSNNLQIVQACLVAGLYPNICFIDRGRKRIMSRLENVVFHPKSALKPSGNRELRQYIDKLSYDWIAFFEKTKTGMLTNICYSTLISPLIVAIFAGVPPRKSIASSSEEKERDSNDDDNDDNDDNDCDKKGEDYQPNEQLLDIDDWIKFYVREDDNNIIKLLKQSINITMVEFLKHGKIDNKRDCDDLTEVIQEVLKSEIGTIEINGFKCADNVMSHIGYFNKISIN